MKFLRLCAVLGFLTFAACTDDDGATRVLREQGYTDITITGYDVWLCGDDYDYHTGFSATTVAGYKVTGAVCSGFTKGYSIKLNN